MKVGSRTPKILAVLFGAAWLASGVAAQVHRVAVAHTYCVEHAALEDRDPSDNQGDDQHPDEGHSTGHEHCPFQLALQPTHLSDPNRIVVPQDVPQRREEAARPLLIASVRGLLHAAPKTSPPAAT